MYILSEHQNKLKLWDCRPLEVLEEALRIEGARSAKLKLLAAHAIRRSCPNVWVQDQIVRPAYLGCSIRQCRSSSESKSGRFSP